MRLFIKAAASTFIICLIFIVTSATDEPFDCAQFQCWDGITPGQTTFDEAIKLLRLFHGKQNVTVYNDGVLWTQHHEPFLSGFLPTTNQQSPQSIQIHFQNPRPTVAEMLDILREPTAVYIIRGPTCNEARLVHEEHNTILWLNTIQITGPGQSSRMISAVHAEQPVGTLTILSPKQSASQTFGNTYTRIDWQGYTDYCQLLNR